MMTTILREAQPGDAPALADLFRQLGYEASADALRERLAQAGAQTRILVAETAHGVGGVIVMHVLEPVHIAGRWALVSALVVDEAARGSRIGAALLNAAEGHALEAGCTRIELSSSEQRTRAHRFYELQGYAERRKRFVKALSSGANDSLL